MRIKFSKQVQSFFKNGSVNVIGSAAASFLAFLFNYVVVQKMSMADYGEYVSTMAYVTLLTVPLSILSIVIIKKISEKKLHERSKYLQQLNATLWEIIKVNWWLILFGLPLVWWWLQVSANFTSGMSAILVILMIVLSVLTSWLNALVSGLQMFVALTSASIVAMGTRLLIGWGVLSLDQSLGSLYGVLIVAALGQVLICRWMVRKKTQMKLVGKTEASIFWWRYLSRREMWIPLATTMTMTGLINLDLIVVKMVGTPDFAGEYGLYSLFAKILMYATGPLVGVAFTFFNSPQKNSETKLILQISSVLILAFGAGMTVVYAVLPTFLITVVGKAQYLGLRDGLYLAAIFGGLYSLAYLLSQYLVAKNRRFAFGGLAIVILQVMLIYFFHRDTQEIMLINIICGGLLIAFYGLGILIKNAAKSI